MKDKIKMKRLITVFAVATIILAVSGVAQAVNIDFETFYIRNNDGSIVAPWDSDMSIVENAAGDGFAAKTPNSGQKVGYGTNAFDGEQINQIESADFTKVSGKDGVVPYINMWVTDGTNYAIIASESDYRGTDFSTRQAWKVFEYNAGVGLDWFFDSGTGARDGAQYLTLDGTRVNLADFSNSITLADPGSPYPSYVGTGAPRGGFGFNIIFGDTQSNYTGSYHISDLTVDFDGQTYNAIPEPATIALLGLGALSLLRRRKA